MKKFFTFIIILSFWGSGMLYAQHLTFKGVPINGTLKEFSNALTQKGFQHVMTQDGLAVFAGDFAGYKDCTIGVITLQNHDVVSQVSVLFSDQDTWSSLISQYEKLKALLTLKYGEPDRFVEEFSGYVGDDYFKMAALHSGEYKWYTSFVTDNGEIQISLIEGSKHQTGVVRLAYYDKINFEKIQQAAIDDL